MAGERKTFEKQVEYYEVNVVQPHWGPRKGDAERSHEELLEKLKKPPPKGFLARWKEERVQRKKQKKLDKSVFPQLQEIEDVHRKMNRCPYPNSQYITPRDGLVNQEIADSRKINPLKSGFRLKASPDIVLNKKQFSQRAEELMGMTEEERANLMLEDSQRYERRSWWRRRK